MWCRRRLCLALALWAITTTHAKYVKDVKDTEWTVDLRGSSLLKGNGVVTTRDGSILVTTAEGRLHILDPQQRVTTFTPDIPIVSCTSEPVLLDADTVVYAVHTGVSESRVYAVRWTEAATALWHAVVPGRIAGSPAVGADGTIYVTHNFAVNNRSWGQISVLRQQRVVATLPQPLTNTPFAPPAVVSRAAGDVVVLGESRENGLSQFGALYSLTWSRVHGDRNGVGNQSYTFRRLPTALRSTNTAPTLAEDLRVYLGTQGSLVVGWDQGSHTALFEQNSQVTLYPWGSLMELDPDNYFSREYMVWWVDDWNITSYSFS